MKRHDDAYRRRAGMIGALASCVCTWPLDVEPTASGHHEACPAELMLNPPPRADVAIDEHGLAAEHARQRPDG